MNEIKSIGQIWGQHPRPQIPYKKYEAALYEYKTNPKAKAALEYLVKTRGLKPSTLQHFHVGYNEEQHEITIPVIKESELIDYKYRGILEKTFRRTPGSENWVVNEQAFQYATEDGYIILVEGEFDAMALYQLGFRSVVSTTSGAQGPTPWIGKIPENVKVYINYDNDEAGQDAKERIAERIGIERCYDVTFAPETGVKDANDYIRTGGTHDDFERLLKTAPKFKIKDVFRVSDIIDSLEKNKLKRIDVFSKRLTNQLDGGVPNQSLVTILGRTGSGKSSTLMNLLVHHADKGRPVLLVSLENDIYFTVQRLLEIKYKKSYTRFTKKEWLNIRSDMLDYPFYIDVSMETFTLDKIEKVIEQAKKLYGIEFFGFDHIGFLPTRDDPKEISQMVRGFKLIARKHNIITYMVSHVRRGQDSTDYITVEDAKGSSSIGQDSDIVLVVMDTKAGHEICIDKARMSRSKLRVPMIFDGASGVMSDDMERSVKHYDEEVSDTVEQKVFAEETEEKLDY